MGYEQVDANLNSVLGIGAVAGGVISCVYNKNSVMRETLRLKFLLLTRAGGANGVRAGRREPQLRERGGVRLPLVQAVRPCQQRHGPGEQPRPRNLNRVLRNLDRFTFMQFKPVLMLYEGYICQILLF